jgi:uncharacterized coiled-coil protein SlyX
MSEEKLVRIEDKIDKINDKLAETNIIMVKQQVILEEHTRRSTMLEKKIVPIEKHVSMMNGVFKFLGILGTLAAIAEFLWMIYK